MMLTFGVIDYIIYGSYSEQLQQSKVELNNYGAFDIHFTLPDNVNLGNGYARFTLLDSNSNTKHYFQIQEFRNRTGCEGKLFVGGCLNGAYVRWTVQAATTIFTPANQYGYMFGRARSFCYYSRYDRKTKILYPKKYFQDEPVQTKVIVTDIDGNLIDNILVRCDVIGYGSEIKEDQNGLTIFEEIKDEQTLTIVSSNKGAVNIAYTPKLVKGLNF
ncbi:unnamed protein product [Rotaria socialis]|uniref:Macroglobulin domain-containing protein n=1 Tax=Rotaria socialis TaxID=392032 RepID=A0A820SPV8_9BILA|nr:unnamed protein product [Rotaria socialis]